MSYDGVSALIALSGSALSATTTFVVLICFAVWRNSHKSFRHALVFNLALADFINSLSNTVSGIIYIRNHELLAGPACTFGGWVGQLSVQATDFSILAISLVTLAVVLQKGSAAEASTLRKTLICLSVWFIPLITSTVVAALGAIKPVSGNWCWISKDRNDLRYGLTHGWRFAIMLTTIIVYTYIWRHLSRTGLKFGDTSSTASRKGRSWHRGKNFTRSHDGDSQENLSTPLSFFDAKTSDDDQAMKLPVYHSEATVASDFIQEQKKKSNREVKHMLLLSGYPIMYILLWIPSIVNRILEATGSTAVSSRTLSLLQAPAQFVGFCNAVTYSLILILRGRMRERNGMAN
ncbi:hypothetical protein DSL72_008354 [Monilinia vaccinii-corymbosi]|uniref:G-protein coupled receptors family 1 profile domain-containing protein n=1 Tax=Monilinia vaccinii-corymbosi TaxID=61207 RepID=A0A8A3PKJ3_9HELO|nr:hypothetical protein DSL72_008354 [Monilinia vaccinii-corymbosi]